MIVSRDLRRALAAVIVVALGGATAFGLWHLVVGGMLNGNPRAAAFGAVLAIVAATLLGGTTAVARRSLRS